LTIGIIELHQSIDSFFVGYSNGECGDMIWHADNDEKRLPLYQTPALRKHGKKLAV